MAILPVPLLVSLVLVLDRLEPEPWRNLVFAFMWGAGVAVLGALILNTLGLVYITGPLFGAEQGHFISAVIGARSAAPSSTVSPTASSTRRWSRWASP
jgi:hypothetical protein